MYTSYCILLFLHYVYFCCCRYVFEFCENKPDRKGLLLIIITTIIYSHKTHPVGLDQKSASADTGMERLLRPERLDMDRSSPTVAQEWKHWLKTFKNFLGAPPQDNLDKLSLLTNFVSPRLYETISECTVYDEAIRTLQSQYVKPTNEVFARHRLATRRQQVGESWD